MKGYISCCPIALKLLIGFKQFRTLYVFKIRDKLIQLATQRGAMMEQWEDRWEHLQLSM